MKYIKTSLAAALLTLLPAMSPAAEEVIEFLIPQEAKDLQLDDFKWQARPVVVFADSAQDPAFITQMELLMADPPALLERDVIIITDTDPAAKSDIRQKLRPRGFMLVLVGKEGGVKLRKPFPWNIRELTRVIDKSPIRKREIKGR